ncbi:MAG: glycosyltransferase [Lachnospiraceae bacterium]|nr:glycosyltransferase [Lachnospiraceae bacterium]
MKKIKVLMVAGSMDVGGIESQLMHLFRNADKDKFQIDFTSTMANAIHRKEIEENGGKFLLIPHMNWTRPWEYCGAMLKIMKDGGYDIVHSHELFHSGVTLFLAKMAGIPGRFVHAHNWCDGDGTGRKTSIVRRFYNSVMRVLINSCSTVRIACSSWAGEFVYGKKMIQKPGYYLVYNSVDTAKFLDLYDNEEAGEFVDPEWINVLNVGRFTPVKNQLFLVDIAEELRRKGKKIRFLCAGSNSAGYLDAVQQEVEEKGLQEYVKLLGVRKDIDNLMRKSHAFVLPSKYEGMPLVMIEAQSSGLPCVSAATYSPEVDFEIGKLTWLYLDDGPAVWAEHIENAINGKRASKEQVEKAIENKGFDSRCFSEKLCSLYEKEVRLRGEK